MVASVIDNVTTIFVSATYQLRAGVATKYYPGGAFRVGTTLYYSITDHLGSTSLTINTTTGEKTEMRYKAWGEVRYSSGGATTPIDKTYTGQRSYASDFGLQY